MNENIRRALLRDEPAFAPDGSLEHPHEVVPTARIRSAALIASAAAGVIVNRSECIRCRAIVSLCTGRKVPAPTCSVTKACGSRERISGRKMETSGRCRHRARLLRKNGLVTLCILRIRRAMEIGRQGNLPAAIRIDHTLKLTSRSPSS